MIAPRTLLSAEASRAQRGRLRLPTAGALISLALHGAAAAALISNFDALSGAGNGAATASTGATVTVVVDSLSEDATTDAVAMAAVVTQALPTAAPNAAAATPTEPQKTETAPPESPVPDATLKAAIEPEPPKPEQKPEQPQEPAPAQQSPASPQATAVASAMASTPIETPAPTQQAAVSASPGDMVRYANKIRTRLAAHRPTGIGVRGKVVVTFIVGAGGAIESIDVAQTSGQTRLDRIVVASVRDAAPFPSPPDLATAGQRTFSIPFEFR